MLAFFPKKPASIPQKVLVVTQNLPPAICGVGDYATLFAQELVRQAPEIKVAFLSRQPGSPNAKPVASTTSPDSLSAFELYQVAPFHWKFYNLPALLKVVRQSQASLVHVHYVPQMYYR